MVFEESAVMPLWFDYVPEALVVFDRQDKIQGWNRAAQKLFRFTTSDAIGLSFLLFIPPRHQLSYTQACDATRQFGSWGGELKMDTALNNPLQVDAKWSYISETDVIIGMFTDVSKLRQEQELMRQSSEWKIASQLMKSLLSSLAGKDPETVHRQLKNFLQNTEPLNRFSLFRGNGEHVLLVMQDALQRDFTRALLDATGYRPFIASDRYHAAEIAREFPHRMTATVVDYARDTCQVMTAIRRWQPLMPIISIGDSEGEPFAILGEPMDPLELLQAVAEAVADSNLRDETLGE